MSIRMKTVGRIDLRHIPCPRCGAPLVLKYVDLAHADDELGVYCNWDCPRCGEELFGGADGRITTVDVGFQGLNEPQDCYFVSESRKAPARRPASIRESPARRTTARKPAARRTATKGARR